MDLVINNPIRKINILKNIMIIENFKASIFPSPWLLNNFFLSIL